MRPLRTNSQAKRQLAVERGFDSGIVGGNFHQRIRRGPGDRAFPVAKSFGEGGHEGWSDDGADTYLFMEAMGNDTFHGGAGAGPASHSSVQSNTCSRQAARENV